MLLPQTHCSNGANTEVTGGRPTNPVIPRASGRRVEAKTPLPQEEVRELSFHPAGARQKGAASGRKVEAKANFP